MGYLLKNVMNGWKKDLMQMQVGAHIGVGVLVYGEPARRVLHENINQPLPRHIGGEVAENLAGDQMAPPAPRFEAEFSLTYHGLFRKRRAALFQTPGWSRRGCRAARSARSPARRGCTPPICRQRASAA